METSKVGFDLANTVVSIVTDISLFTMWKIPNHPE